MTSVSTDRRHGVGGSLGVKAPVKASTTANITLSGEQTIDSVAVTSGDRILVRNQTSGSENGIYAVNTSDWQREPDWNGNRDIVTGTSIYVTSGGSFGNYRVTNANPIVIGTTAITFDWVELDDTLRSQLGSTATDDDTEGYHLVHFPPLAAETGVTDYEYDYGDVRRFGATGDGTTDDTTAIQNTVDSSSAIFFPLPSSYYNITAEITGLTNKIIYGEGSVAGISKIRNTSTGNVFNATDNDRWIIDRMDIQAGSAGIGVVAETGAIKTCKWFELKNSRIHDCGGRGIQIKGAILGKINFNEIRDNGGHGLFNGYSTAGSTKSANLTIVGNYFFTNTGSGLYMDGTTSSSSEMHIEKNVAESNTSHGFYLDCDDSTLITNTAESNGGDGFVNVANGQQTHIGNYALSNTGQGFNVDSGSRATYVNCRADSNTGNDWDINAGTTNQTFINCGGTITDNNGTNTIINGTDVSTIGSRYDFNVGLTTIQSTANVSSPPTDAELDAAFGTPATLGRSFIGFVDDASLETDMWMVTTSDNSWWYSAMTKAV